MPCIRRTSIVMRCFGVRVGHGSHCCLSLASVTLPGWERWTSNSDSTWAPLKHGTAPPWPDWIRYFNGSWQLMSDMAILTAGLRLGPPVFRALNLTPARNSRGRRIYI